MRLAGKRALISGAGSGIGREAALLVFARGRGRHRQHGLDGGAGSGPRCRRSPTARPRGEWWP